MPKISKLRTEWIYIALGFTSLILGIIGIFVPLLPTTPFLILTAFLFNKGSQRFHAWLLNNRYFGPPIKDWQKTKSIPLKIKLLATGMLATSGYYLFTKPMMSDFGKLSFAIFTLGVLVFIWTRKSSPK